MLYQSDKSSLRYKLIQFTIPMLGVCGALLLWEVLFLVFRISPLVLVAPSEFIPVGIAKSDIILSQLTFTMTTALAGWCLGLFVGVVLAIITHHIPIVSRYVLVISVGVNAIPLIALIAIMSGILGTTQQTKIIITAVFVLFPTIVTCLFAFATVPQNLKSLFHIYAVSQKTQFLKLTLPYSIPSLLVTMRVTVLSAFLTAIVTEFFGSQKGIGQFILANRGLYRLPLVWAALMYVVMAGAVWYGAVALVERWLVSDKR